MILRCYFENETTDAILDVTIELATIDLPYTHQVPRASPTLVPLSEANLLGGGEGCKNQSCSEFDEESNGTGLAAKFEKKFFAPW